MNDFVSSPCFASQDFRTSDSNSHASEVVPDYFYLIEEQGFDRIKRRETGKAGHEVEEEVTETVSPAFRPCKCRRRDSVANKD